MNSPHPRLSGQSEHRFDDNVFLQPASLDLHHQHRVAEQSSLTALLSVAQTSARDDRGPEPPKGYFSLDLFGRQTTADASQLQLRRAGVPRQCQDLFVDRVCKKQVRGAAQDIDPMVL